MLMPRVVGWMFSVGMMVLGTGVVSGQNYPNKPIRILTTAPGSGADLVGRLIAPRLLDSLAQPVVIDNRGIIAIETVARAPADGYTLVLYGSPLWLLPFMRDNVPWDPLRDFSPITLAVSTPNVLVVHPSVPVKSVKELIALAKARPGELNYASTTGSTPHLGAELFKAMAGIDIVHIPYKGTGPAILALLGGQVQAMFPAVGSAVPYVKSGKLRALAVTSAQPSALAPGLPTVAAAGLPGYEAVSIIGILAPAGTRATIIGRLNQEIVRILNQTNVKEQLFSTGVETVGSSPEQFAATVKSEMARLGKVIKDASIRAE